MESKVNFQLIKTDPKKFWSISAWVLPLIAISITILAVRIWKIPPKLMGDELYYNWNARLFDPSEWTLPNYLFSLAYRSTSFCGLDYYYCTKGLNVFFTLAFSFIIYLTARKFAKPLVSLFVAILTFLGPLGSYASYFTPDSMFYFFASLLLYFTFQQSAKSNLFQWSVVGVLIGLASLIKPHAIFLIPAILIYVIVIYLKREGSNSIRALGSVAVMLAAFSTVKFGIGYLFGGTKGLTILGSSYDASLNTVLTNTSDKDGGKILGENFSSALMDFANQSLLHWVFILVFSSLPIFALGSLLIKALRTKEQLIFSERFVILLSLALISLVFVVSIFSSVSSAWGEFGLRTRLIIRYYEYILPFVPLVTLAYISAKRPQSKEWTRWLLGVLVITVTLWGAVTTQATIPAQFADSSLLGTILLGGTPYLAFAIISAALVIYWAKNPIGANKAWLFAYYPGLILYFISASYINFTVPANNGIYEEVALYTSENLSQSERDKVFILGNDKFLIQTTQFWLDTNKSRGAMVPEGASVFVDRLPEDVEYVLLVGNVQLVGEAKVLRQEPNWMVVELK